MKMTRCFQLIPSLILSLHSYSYGMNIESGRLIYNESFYRCYQDTIPADSLQAVRPDSGIHIDSLVIPESVTVDPDTAEPASIEDPVKSDKEIIFSMGDISFADSVVLYDPGAYGENTGDEPELRFRNASTALGPPDFIPDENTGFVSLGKGGFLILKFKLKVWFMEIFQTLFVCPSPSSFRFPKFILWFPSLIYG